LDASDLETLKAKERAKSAPTFLAAPGVETGRIPESTPGGPSQAFWERYARRRLAQINRRSPIEKATSPLKLVLFFTDLEETTRQMDTLWRALEEARPIANDASLNEEQKRVTLRKTLKAATSAIWASHHSGGKREQANTRKSGS
jgi:hypothetical protein